MSILLYLFIFDQSGPYVNGSWVIGQMGHKNYLTSKQVKSVEKYVSK